MSDIREGLEVEFECGHRMVYDRYSDQGVPEVGELGRCRQCATDEHFLGVDRVVVGIRQCWIETTTHVHFSDPRKSRQ